MYCSSPETKWIHTCIYYVEPIMCNEQEACVASWVVFPAVISLFLKAVTSNSPVGIMQTNPAGSYRVFLTTQGCDDHVAST